MHEFYDDEEEYEDYDDYDYDYGTLDPYKFYFKFDVAGTPLSDWITNMINNVFGNPVDKIDQSFGITNISDFPFVSLPVSSWNPNTEDNKFQYLGSNYVKEPIWKSKYWINNPINQSYKAHIQSNATHFIKQPAYYKGLFDILN